jgi:hypothetical protein
VAHSYSMSSALHSHSHINLFVQFDQIEAIRVDFLSIISSKKKGRDTSYTCLLVDLLPPNKLEKKLTYGVCHVHRNENIKGVVSRD